MPFSLPVPDGRDGGCSSHRVTTSLADGLTVFLLSSSAVFG